ncbi:hypothetical protein ACIBJF_48365, partial [Streptomyces sp. NPDC050743]
PCTTGTRSSGHAPSRRTVTAATCDDDFSSGTGYWYHQRTQDPHPAARDPEFQNRLLHALKERTGVRLN